MIYSIVLRDRVRDISSPWRIVMGFGLIYCINLKAGLDYVGLSQNYH
jgi:hypothetical protein